MKTKINLFRIIAIIAIIVLGFTTCTGGGSSGRNFTDVTKVEDWLANQKGGASPDDPISFNMKLNLQNMTSLESNWQKLLTSINTAGLYVALDLSSSTMPNTEFNADDGVRTGKQFIVSLVLPDGTESIAGNIYEYFDNIRTIKGRNIEWFIENTDPASWLANQKGGASPDDPISFSMKLNLQDMESPESNWQKLLTSINTAGLYVALDLSSSTIPNTEFNAYGGRTGNQFIVSLILPDSTESINGILFAHFVNLKTARAQKIEVIIGSTGPAGGIVFYDKGEYTDGWRYLEAAPADMNTTLAWASSTFIGTGNRRSIDGTNTAIGTGKQNTALILSVDANAPAAKACADYRGGGKDDWFLPSIDELSLMYLNLKVNNIGGFYRSNFWSSSQNQNSDGSAWSLSFTSGNRQLYGKGTSNEYGGHGVRAIRAF